MQLKRKSSLFLLVLATLASGADAYAEASGKFFNPITDVAWQSVFPIRVGGIRMKRGNGDAESSEEDKNTTPLCICPKSDSAAGMYVGLDISFWEPVSLIETTKEPYYSPMIGKGFSGMQNGTLAGALDETKTNPMTFAQTHLIKFPVFAVLSLLSDVKCVQGGGVDYGYLSEVVPTDNDALLSGLLSPESLLFANPVAVMACIPNDGIVAQLRQPFDYDFWCAWGTVYPLSNHKNSDKYSEANAALAARLLYKMSRYGTHVDYTVNKCKAQVLPIWRKSNYRLQIARPVKGNISFPIGRSVLQWGSSKNPPFKAGGNAGDEFLWVLFQKKNCCEELAK